MNYVTTNIRIPEDDYLRLKIEAAKKRLSLSAVIRQKIGSKNNPGNISDIKKVLSRLELIARKNGKILNGFDSVRALRETRYHGKW